MSVQELIDATFEVTSQWGYHYMYLARPVIEKYGKKGEVAVREGVRNLGVFRGRELKKWHEAEGLPLNMESFIRFWDCGGKYLYETKYAPYEVLFQVPSCPMYEAWKDEGFEWFGYWLCDEMHQEITKTYNKDAIVEVHENLAKGDDFCDFHFMMVPSGPTDRSSIEALNKKMEEQPEKYALRTLKQTVRCIGATYGFMAQAIVRHFGEDVGKDILIKANADLGEKRGRRIKERLEALGEPLTVKNIFEMFDFPYKRIWGIKEVQSDGTYVAQADYCPFAEVWGEEGHLALGAFYCDAVYESLFRAFSKEADVRIPECLARKGNRCRFEFKL